MLDDGFDVTGYMMRRRDDIDPEWQNVDLGRTRDGAMLSRLKSIFTGARIAASDPRLARVDVMYARNLDMLATAFLAKRRARLKTPVIYECLDIHGLLAKQNPVGVTLRWLERRLLKRCAGLVTSSPGFLRNYFERYHSGLYRAFLIENRMAAGADYGQRPAHQAKSGDGPLRLGWVGMLRCDRTLNLICELADRFPDDLIVKIHGTVSRNAIPVFEPKLETRANIHFSGRYKAPEDLEDIYADIDVVWAGDFMDAGYNSVWLLPNRIYEGGYYAVPAIAPAKTETANWLLERNAGFCVDEPLTEMLPKLIAKLIADRSHLEASRAALLDLPEHQFIQPPGFMTETITAALSKTG